MACMLLYRHTNTFLSHSVWYPTPQNTFHINDCFINCAVIGKALVTVPGMQWTHSGHIVDIVVTVANICIYKYLEIKMIIIKMYRIIEILIYPNVPFKTIEKCKYSQKVYFLFSKEQMFFVLSCISSISVFFCASNNMACLNWQICVSQITVCLSISSGIFQFYFHIFHQDIICISA